MQDDDGGRSSTSRRGRLRWAWLPLRVLPWTLVLALGWPAPPYAVDMLAQLAPPLCAAVLLIGLALLALRRWRVGVEFVASAVVGLGLVLGLRSAISLPEGAPGREQTIRVVIYNCYGDAARDDGAFVRWLAEVEADLVALVQAPSSFGPAWDPVWGAYPHRLEPERGSRWPILLLSRHPAEPVLRPPTPETRFIFGARRLLEVRPPRGGRLLFTAANPPSPRGPGPWSMSLRWASGAGPALRTIRSELGLPLVVASDINSTPTGRLAHRFGRASGLRAALPAAWAGSYPSWLPGPLARPIDLIWASEGVRARRVVVGPRCASDHRPVLTDLHWAVGE